MADMVIPGMAAVESAAKIYRNREEPFSSGVLAGSNGVGKTVGGSAAEKIRASFREYMEDALESMKNNPAYIPLKNYGWMMGAQGALASLLLSAAGFSGLGLASSGFSGLGLASSGLLSSGLSGYGLLSGGLSSAGLLTLGASRASMVNAYKNTLKNRSSDGKTRLSERR